MSYDMRLDHAIFQQRQADQQQDQQAGESIRLHAWEEWKLATTADQREMLDCTSAEDWFMWLHNELRFKALYLYPRRWTSPGWWELLVQESNTYQFKSYKLKIATVELWKEILRMMGDPEVWKKYLVK